jgi:hypothetical protein
MTKYRTAKEKMDRTQGDPRRVAFERLFERRIEVLREDARLIANLSNPYNYTYGMQDIDHLREEMSKLLRTTVDAFEMFLPTQETLRVKRKNAPRTKPQRKSRG